MLTKDNLTQRMNSLRIQLGALAYERREKELRIEEIDSQVAQMEAQAVLIEATLKDLNTDEAVERAKRGQEFADAKEKRQAAARKGLKARKARQTGAEGKRKKTAKHET